MNTYRITFQYDGNDAGKPWNVCVVAASPAEAHELALRHRRAIGDGDDVRCKCILEIESNCITEDIVQKAELRLVRPPPAGYRMDALTSDANPIRGNP